MAKKTGGKNLELGISLDTSQASSSLELFKTALGSIGQQAESFQRVEKSVEKLAAAFAGMASVVGALGDMKGVVGNLAVATAQLGDGLTATMKRTKTAVEDVGKEAQKLAMLDAKFDVSKPTSQLKTMQLTLSELKRTGDISLSVKAHGTEALRQALREAGTAAQVTMTEAGKDAKYVLSTLKQQLDVIKVINQEKAQGARHVDLVEKHGTIAVSDANAGVDKLIQEELLTVERQQTLETQKQLALTQAHSEALKANASIDRKNAEYSNANLDKRIVKLTKIDELVAAGKAISDVQSQHGTSAVSDATSGKLNELLRERAAIEQGILDTNQSQLAISKRALAQQDSIKQKRKDVQDAFKNDDADRVKNSAYILMSLEKQLAVMQAIKTMQASGVTPNAILSKHGSLALQDVSSGADKLIEEELLGIQKKQVLESQKRLDLTQAQTAALKLNGQIDKKNADYESASIDKKITKLEKVKQLLATGTPTLDVQSQHGTTAVAEATSGKLNELLKERASIQQVVNDESQREVSNQKRLKELREDANAAFKLDDADKIKNLSYQTKEAEKQLAIMREIRAMQASGVSPDAIQTKHGSLAVTQASDGTAARLEKELLEYEERVTREEQKQLILREQNEAHQKALNKHLAEGLATTKSTTTAATNLGSSMHDANRGFTAGLGAIWLSWGSMLPIMAGFAASSAIKKMVTDGADLEATLSKVRSVTDEGVRPSIQGLTKDVLELSKTSQSSPQELAKGLNALAQAGIEAREGLRNMPVVDQLATVGEMDTGKAAEFLAGLQSAFGGPTKNTFQQIGNVMAQVAADSQTTLPEISEAMKQSSTVAEQYGVSITDVGVALEVMAKNNVRGSAAGTAFRNMMEDITGRTEKSRKAFDAIGFSFFTATGELKPLGQGVNELRDKLENATPKARDMALKLIGSERGLKSLIPLLEMGASGYDKLSNSLDKARNGSALKDMFTLQTDNLKGDWQKTSNAFTSALEGMFLKSGDSLRAFVKELGAAFQSKDFEQFLDVVTSGLKILAGVLLFAVKHAKELTLIFAAWQAIKFTSIIGQLSIAVAQSVLLRNRLGEAAAAERLMSLRGGPAVSSLITRVTSIPGLVATAAVSFYAITHAIGEVADKSAHRLDEISDSITRLRRELSGLVDATALTSLQGRQVAAHKLGEIKESKDKLAQDTAFLQLQGQVPGLTREKFNYALRKGDTSPLLGNISGGRTIHLSEGNQQTVSKTFTGLISTLRDNANEFNAKTSQIGKANFGEGRTADNQKAAVDEDKPKKPGKGGKTKQVNDATAAMAEEVKRLAEIQLNAQKQRLSLQEDIVKLEEDEVGYAKASSLEAVKREKLATLDQQAAVDKAGILKEIGKIDERSDAKRAKKLIMTQEEEAQDRTIKLNLQEQLGLNEQILKQKHAQVETETALAIKQAESKAKLSEMMNGKLEFNSAQFGELTKENKDPSKLVDDKAAAVRSVEEAIKALNSQARQVGWTDTQKTIDDWAVKLREAGVDAKIVELQLSDLKAALEKLEKKKGDPMEGFKQGLEEYGKKLEDVAGATKGVMTNALQKTEDAFVSLVTTGKFSFKDLATSILADLARIAIQQTLMKPLTQWLQGGFSPTDTQPKNTPVSGYQTGGGFLSSVLGFLNTPLFANGGTFGTAHAFANGGAFTNSVFSSPTNFKFANGGGFSLGTMGEAGPEAVMPLVRDKAGRLGVRGQDGGGQGTQSVQTINVTHAPVFNIDSRSDRAQVEQIARSAAQQGNAQLVDTLRRQRVI